MLNWQNSPIGKQPAESPETMRKLCLSVKFPHQEIRWNYGIFRRGHLPYWTHSHELLILNHENNNNNVVLQLIHKLVESSLIEQSPKSPWWRQNFTNQTMLLSIRVTAANQLLMEGIPNRFRLKTYTILLKLIKNVINSPYLVEGICFFKTTDNLSLWIQQWTVKYHCESTFKNICFELNKKLFFTK